MPPTDIWTINKDTGAVSVFIADGPDISNAGASTAPLITPVNPPAASNMKKRLVAVGDNKVFYETATAGTMAELLAARNTIDTSKECVVFEAYQKAFIVNEDVYKIVDFANSKLSTTLLGSNVPERGIILTGGTSSAQMSLDFITTSSGSCDLYGIRITEATFVSGETVTGVGGVSFVLNADELAPTVPHYYNYTPYGNDTTTYGSLPEFATIGCLYRGRISLSGNRKAPFQWYLSRQGNPFDFAYGATDIQAPVAGGSSDVGELGDVIISLIPYKDDYLVFGCANSMWLLRGDPAAGGTLNELSLTTGIFGRDSFCYGENDVLYWLSNDGLYSCVPGVSTINNLTKTTLPDFPKSWNLSKDADRALLAFDKINRGVCITATNVSAGTNQTYWYDLKTNGFFPESYAENNSLYSIYQYNSLDDTYTGLLRGSKDGFIRIYDRAAKNDNIGDEDVAIDSYISYGPLPLTNDIDRSGRLLSLSITSTDVTDSIEYAAFIDKTAEGVVYKIENNPTTAYVFNGSIAGTTNRPARILKRAFGTFLGIRIGNDTINETWSMEVLTGVTAMSGRFKENS